MIVHDMVWASCVRVSSAASQVHGNHQLSQGTMAKLSAVGASAVPEDSASDVDSGPLLLPANGEAASGTSAQGKKATGRGAPKPSAAERGAR